MTSRSTTSFSTAPAATAASSPERDEHGVAVVTPHLASVREARRQERLAMELDRQRHPPMALAKHRVAGQHIFAKPAVAAKRLTVRAVVLRIA